MFHCITITEAAILFNMSEPATIEECDAILNRLEAEFDYVMLHKTDNETGWGSTAHIREEYARVGLIRVKLFMAQQADEMHEL